MNAKKGGERREEVQVPSLRIPYARNSHPDIVLRFHTSNMARIGGSNYGNNFRLPNHLAMLEEGWKRGQSSDSIPVQEDRSVGNLRGNAGDMDMLHHIKVAPFHSRDTNGSGIHILFGAGEQLDGIEKTVQSAPGSLIS